MAASHKLANLPEVLVYRREHPSRTTHEQASLIKHQRLKIYASQLTALGIECTNADLERHFMLRRMQKEDFTPNRDYVEWAEGWMVRLQSANQKTGLYPEPAFSHELGVFWFKTCCQAFTRNGGWGVWRKLLTSPLCRSVWPGLWKLAWLNMPISLGRRRIAR